VAISDSKATRRQLKELRHHDRAMESYGLYSAPYKYEKRLYLGPQQTWTQRNNKEKTLKMPAGVTTNIQFNWQNTCIYHILDMFLCV